MLILMERDAMAMELYHGPEPNLPPTTKEQPRKATTTTTTKAAAGGSTDEDLHGQGLERDGP